MTVYPEHEKLSLVAEHSQLLGEFLDWLQGERRSAIFRSEEVLTVNGQKSADLRWVRYGASIEQLLADFYQIDLNKLEKEKNEMLAEMRRMKEAAGLV